MKHKVWRKITSILISIILLLCLFGCSGLNEREAKIISDELENKYGIEFKVISIGGRWMRNSTTAYCTPKDDPELVFKVYLNKDGSVSDRYVARAVGRQFEDMVNGMFRVRGIESQMVATHNVSSSKKEYENFVPTLQDVIDNYESKAFGGTVILPDSFREREGAAEIVVDIYRELQEELKGNRIGIGVVLIADEEFQIASGDMRLNDDAGTPWLARYTVTGQFRLSNSAEEIDVVFEKIRNDLTNQ